MAEKPDDGRQQPHWTPSQRAVARAQQIYLEDLPAIDLVDLTGWLTVQLQGGANDNHPDCRVYADALYDMSRLIDELRFETSLAAVYIMELGDQPSIREHNRDQLAGAFRVPGTAIALLSPQLGDKPFVAQLFSEPITPLAGHRVLAGWFSAQLLDSALIRSVATLDCVAILLFSASGRPFAVDGHNDLLLPSFCAGDLELMVPCYGSHPAWPGLYQLTEHSSFQMARAYRHGFIHRRRVPTELHGGAEAIVSFGGESSMPVLGKLDQLSMVRDFYCGVLHVATRLAGELLRPAGD
jgi:hypothetical protein